MKNVEIKKNLLGKALLGIDLVFLHPFLFIASLIGLVVVVSTAVMTGKKLYNNKKDDIPKVLRDADALIASETITDQEKLDLLINAITSENTKQAIAIINKNDIDLNKLDDNGLNALMYSILYDNEEVFNKLIEAPGIDLDIQMGKSNQTALMRAINDRKIHFIEKLLSKDVDITKEDANDKTAEKLLLENSDVMYKDKMHEMLEEFKKTKEANLLMDKQTNNFQRKEIDKKLSSKKTKNYPI